MNLNKLAKEIEVEHYKGTDVYEIWEDTLRVLKRWHKELMSELPSNYVHHSKEALGNTAYGGGWDNCHDAFMKHLRLEEKPTMLVGTSEAIERAKKVLDAGEKPVWCEHMKGFPLDAKLHSYQVISKENTFYKVYVPTNEVNFCPICGMARPTKRPEEKLGAYEKIYRQPLKVPEKLDGEKLYSNMPKEFNTLVVTNARFMEKINEIIDYLNQIKDRK